MSATRPHQAKAARPRSARRPRPVRAPPRGPGDFAVVGIGASAGGLEALEQFLGQVPPDSGLAYLVVQHLDPTHKAMLVELLQRDA